MTTRKHYTVSFIRTGEKILLGLKKRGFGKGKWEGFGGKVEPKETIHDAAVREMQEECGLTPTNLKKIGDILFEYEGETELMDVSVFLTSTYEGELRETDEMTPMWYNIKEIPFDKMWPDSYIWYPWMLREEPFTAYFLYRGHNLIMKHRINPVGLEKRPSEVSAATASTASSEE